MKTRAALLPVKKSMHEKQKSTPIEEIRAFFAEDTHALGSSERLTALLARFPQRLGEMIQYLLAGSWAIELVSGKRLNHEDIDVIVLENISWYLDDAVSSEEHCDGVMPLPRSYFLQPSSVLICENSREAGNVCVPNLPLQICLKLLGELDATLSERALQQLETLFSCYRTEDWMVVEEEMQFIYRRCLPLDLDARALARETVRAIREHQRGEKEVARASCRNIHHTINVSLQKAFAPLKKNPL